MKALLWSLLLAFLAAPAFAEVTADEFPWVQEIPNFRDVSPGIWRSGRPTVDGLNQFKRRGLRTILNLEDHPAPVAEEAAWARANGVRFVNLPIGPQNPVTDELVDEALAVMKEDGPVLVHCHAGQDRTGLIVGLYRVEVEGWTPTAAYQEMLGYGFRAEWHELGDFFWQRVHQPRPPGL